MEDVTYINVDKTKLEQMQQQCLCPFEQPIVAIPLEFKIPGSTTFTSGFLMITCGAHYLFKGKAFGHIALMMKFSIFQVNVIHFSSDQVIFDFSDFGMTNFSLNTDLQSKQSPTTQDNTPISNSINNNNNIQSISNSLIFLKTSDSFIIVQASLYIQKFVSYGLKNVQLCRLDSPTSIKEVELTSRPSNALIYRTIFLAHYYEKANDKKDILNVDYFKKWEYRRPYYIIINSTLQPGKFGRAFGHSISWEKLIKAVCFRSFSPPQFSEFFDSLVANSMSTVSEIQFDSYKDPTNLPEFSGRPLKNENCSIKRYVFHDVIGTFLLSFFEKCTRIPRIEGLVLCNVKMDSTEFTQFCNCVLHNKAMQNTLKKFIFEKSPIQSFPTSDMKIMLECLSHLETITLCDFNCDGVRLINAVCRSKAPVRVIHANRLKFFKSFEKTTFPETLIHLDVSLSLFSDEAISSLLVAITKKEVKIPIIFSAVRIILKKSSYPAIGRINFEKCFPTIAEFNFSLNRIPAFGSRSLFAFLFTQKNLRNLTLNNIGATNSVKLLKNIMMIILSLKIPGFSFSVASEKVLKVLNSLQKKKQAGSQADVEQTSSSPILQQKNEDEDEKDDLLSFDFETTEKPVHSSDFAADLYSLDFTLTGEKAAVKDTSKKSSKKKDLKDKPPPTVTGFDPPTILQFIQALVHQNVTFLRRFVLIDSKMGDKGIAAIMQLIEISPNMNEVEIDGLEPESLESFIALWRTIANSKSIVACQFPSNDAKKVGLEIDKAAPDVKDVFERIKRKIAPSSTNKRVKFTFMMSKQSEQLDKSIFGGDFYEKCAEFVCKDDEKLSNVDDEEEEEDNDDNGNQGGGVWKNSHIGNDKEMDDLLVFDDFN